MFHPWGGGLRQLCERGFMNCPADGKKSRTARTRSFASKERAAYRLIWKTGIPEIP